MSALPQPSAAATPEGRGGDGIRMVPVPGRRAGPSPVRPQVPAGQGTLSLELAPAAPPAPSPHSQVWRDGDDPASMTGDPSRLQDPREWSAMLAQAVVEVLAGRRPATQLVRWLDLEVYERIRRSQLRRPTAAGGAPVRVRRVRVSVSPDGWAEAVAVVDDGRRCRAIALRLEALQRRWLCTELEII